VQIKPKGDEDKYLSVGGGAYADILSIHSYVRTKGQTRANCGAPPANVNCMWPENVASMVLQLNTLQASYGLNLPMMVTEGSYGAHTNTTDAQFQKAFVAREMALLMQYGVQRFYWYNADGGGDNELWSNNATGALKPAGAAYQTIQQWLTGKTFSNNKATITAQPTCSGGANSHTYALPLTSGEKLVWYDETADNASCAYNVTGFSSYLTLNGAVVPIIGSNPTVTLDNRPILLQRFGTFFQAGFNQGSSPVCRRSCPGVWR
jgi:hypothetical protein